MSYLLGIILSFVAMFSFGSYVLFFKKGVNKIGAYSAIAYLRLLGLIIIVIFSLFFVKFRPLPAWAWLNLLIAAVSSALALFFFSKAAKAGKLSIISPISSAFAIPTVIFSFIFLHELIAPVKYFLVLTVVVGIILLSTDFQQLKRLKIKTSSKGIGFALLACCLFGVWATASKPLAQYLTGFSALSYIEIVTCIFILLPVLFKPKILKKPDKKSAINLILATIIWIVSAISIYPAFQYLPASIVTPITSSSPLVTIFLAWIFLKEKLKINHLLGAVLIIGSLIFLSI